MNMDSAVLPWLNSAQALRSLHTMTGITLTGRELLELCTTEVCRDYVDCSFAVGPAPDNQLFVRKVRGAGYCELLEADGLSVFLPDSGSEPLLGVSGTAIVRGSAWVYSSEGQRPEREDGIWRMDLGSRCRTLYFSPADLKALAATLNGGGPTSSNALIRNRAN
ncbi:hypothetical protein D3C78_897320 [compost metagenome]